MYVNDMDGLHGNDDCGQMSAWYIFTSLGFYPVCPSSGYYNIGSPAIPAIDVRMSNGKHIKVTTRNWSKDALYVDKVMVNGRPHNKSYLTWEDIKDGIDIVFHMSKKPNRKWASGESCIAPSVSAPGNTMPYKHGTSL